MVVCVSACVYVSVCVCACGWVGGRKGWIKIKNEHRDASNDYGKVDKKFPTAKFKVLGNTNTGKK